MELREWQYINNPNSNTTSAASTSSTGYKKRFEKLIKYHIDHASSELERIIRKDIKDNYFHLSEHYNDGREEFDRDIVVSYDKASDTFFFRIFVDGKETESVLSKSYKDFVKAIEAYMFLPDSGTQEYDDLLVEWVAMKNTSNTSSQAAIKTNKEKFEELVLYIIDHEKTYKGLKGELVKIDEDGFTYKEQRTNGQGYYEIKLVVNYGKRNPTIHPWQFSIYVNGKHESTETGEDGEGWEEFLSALGKYFKVPLAGTPEYQSLCEWVVMNGSQNNSSSPASSSSSASSKTNKEKFKELTDYMIKNKSSNVYKAEVVRLDEGGFTYKEYRKSPSGQNFTFTLLVGYSRFSPQWKYELYIDTDLEEEKSGNGFNYLLFELYKYFKVPSPGSPEHESICESASFADDFKLYENLWN